MTIEGALVGSVGEKDSVDHKVVGAIASHTWGEYVHAGREEANPAGELRTMLMELEVSVAFDVLRLICCRYDVFGHWPGAISYLDYMLFVIYCFSMYVNVAWSVGYDIGG